MKLSEYIREKREAAGLTQQQACAKAGTSISGWSAWERGKSIPDLLKLRAIADALGVERAEIGAIAAVGEE